MCRDFYSQRPDSKGSEFRAETAPVGKLLSRVFSVSVSGESWKVCAADFWCIVGNWESDIIYPFGKYMQGLVISPMHVYTGWWL